MRLLTALLLVTLPVAAQETPATAAKPQESQSAAPSAQAAEQWFTGSIEAGYRWSTDLRGDSNTYRSVVNLGDGPKLFGVDLSLKNASRSLFDTMTIRGSSWGGDPYNTARIEVAREGTYRLSFDYRNISYFNFLPSFANPLVERGVLLNQRSFDTHRRLIDTELELRPGKRIVPYLAYTRDWGSGRGITDFVTDGNEYPVANTLNDKTDNYRGGVRFEYNRLHLTLEQGGTAFKDDQRVYNSVQQPGNRPTTIFGQQLYLAGLLQAYRVRGNSMYSKALFTASPATWLNVYGQFLYSQPKSNATYTQLNSGNFIAFRPTVEGLQFYGLEQSLLSSEAKQPHPSGSFGAELKLHRRVRVLESILTDRFHTTSSALVQNQFTVLDPSATYNTSQAYPGLERLVFSYNRQEANVLVDVTDRLTLRGGHRYVWGNSEVRSGQLNQIGPQETGQLKMNVGLAGLHYRPAEKLSIHADLEAGSADKNYFRTSLQDYQKVNVRLRYQALTSLSFAAGYNVLRNENPAQGIKYDFRNHQGSLSVFWTPGGGKRFTLTGDYTRSSLRSDLLYLNPGTLGPQQSIYNENANIATGLLDINFPAVAKASPKLALGGSLFMSSGSRQANYYQPLARFSFPVHQKFHWFFEWRWYQLSQPFYLYEGFRTHHLITGLRLFL